MINELKNNRKACYTIIFGTIFYHSLIYKIISNSRKYNAGIPKNFKALYNFYRTNEPKWFRFGNFRGEKKQIGY